jgi:hypothetical protein
MNEIEATGKWDWQKEMDGKRRKELAVMDPAC